MTVFFSETGKYTAREMASMWKHHMQANKTYLQNIDDLIIIHSEEENVEPEKKDSDEREGKKSWFGLWSK